MDTATAIANDLELAIFDKHFTHIDELVVVRN